MIYFLDLRLICIKIKKTVPHQAQLKEEASKHLHNNNNNNEDYLYSAQSLKKL